MRRAWKLLLVLGIGFALVRRPRGGNTDSGGNPRRRGDSGDGGPPKRYKDIDAGKGLDSAHTAIDTKAKDGRPGDSDGDGTPDVAPTVRNSGTQPSNPPDPNNRPRGDKTELEGSTETRRSLGRENESAKTLAEKGYDVEQNPPPKPNGKKPDYKIEGEYFDCYAPKRDDPGRIRDDISTKVKKGQADRIVLNLDDSSVDVNQLRSKLEQRPVSNLQEIKIVQNGQVIDFYPF